MPFGGLHDGATIGISQTPVSYDGVVSVLFQLFNGVPGRRGCRDGVTGCFQDRALEGDNVGFIVNTKDFCHRSVLDARIPWSAAFGGFPTRLSSFSDSNAGKVKLQSVHRASDELSGSGYQVYARGDW
jgi:hypothetical protein